MNKYLMLKKSNCKNCYKCIRNCPVKSIRFTENQATIIEEDCILCGRCFVACPQNAKEIRNDVSSVKALLSSGAPVYASIAPSFVAKYPGATIESMRALFKGFGFADAEETAIGATMVKTCYEDMIREGKQSVIISSCCHTINMLIQKYHPEVLSSLAHVLSPMQAHCSTIKKQHPGAKTVFIGPCISKKSEADQYPGTVDCVLTFEELSEWLSAENVSIEALVDKDGCNSGRARLFPTTGGILRSMTCNNPNYDYLTIDGIENCISALNDIAAGELSNCFVEMSACTGSCVGGPAMGENRIAPVRDFSAVNRYATRSDFKVDMPDAFDMSKNIEFIQLHRQMPGSKAIEEILHKMGKTSPEHELNCGSCGYNTCREKAIAVFNGKADLSMCLPFLKEKAESFSDNIINNTPNGIIVLNESLEVQQINAAALRLMNIRDAGDVLGDQVVRILDPQPFFEVLQKGTASRGKRVYLAEYQRFADQTIIYDRSYHILMCIMRDVTDEETARANKKDISRQTVEITDHVVEKQMRVVQEIASLLGETAAETKIALTKLKESLGNGN